MKRFLYLSLLIATFSTSLFAVEKSQMVVYVNGEKYYVHPVVKGDTFYSLSNVYDIDVAQIKEVNPESKEGLKIGSNIKIPYTEQSNPIDEMNFFRRKRTFKTHTVKSGETLYAISRIYSVPVGTIVADNPDIDPSRLVKSQKILIRKNSLGTSDQSQSQEDWENYKNNLNKVVQDGYVYHIVEPGETIYSLSRQSNMTEKEFILLNKLESGLKSGTIVKMSVLDKAVSQEDEDYQLPVLDSVTLSRMPFKALSARETLNISLILPFSINGEPNSAFSEFYQGFLLGLEDVKAQYGRNINLNVFNSDRSIAEIENIIDTEAFKESDLIVGPVYENLMSPVVSYAEKHRIPFVSPLATISNLKSNVIFQMAPPSEQKYAKSVGLFAPQKHITLIYTDKTDKSFESEILNLLGRRAYSTHKYFYQHPSVIAQRADLYEKSSIPHGESIHTSASDLNVILNNGKDNTIVVMADNETDVDRVLSAISSAYIGITSRGYTAPKFQVLGNSKWNKYKNIDKSAYFKDQVVMFSSYHAKRDSGVIKEFDSRYIETYNNLPSLYSYRGYDVAYIFAEGLFSDIQYSMQGRNFKPLQSNYRFETDPTSGVNINSDWIKVVYNNDFSITIE